jgi:hypothetical protein
MRFFAGATVLLLTLCWLMPAQSSSSRKSPTARKADPTPISSAELKPSGDPPAAKPEPFERLTYAVEWRMIHAGTATFEIQKLHAALKLQSAGMVSTLFRVNDTYTVDFDDPFCATSSTMDSMEGKRHHEAHVVYDRTQGRATFTERDVIRGTQIRTAQTEVPACVHDVLAALLKIRQSTPAVGQSVQIPVSDGRRAAPVKIEALARESVKTAAGTFDSIQCEVFLMNGVVYTRKGRVFIWISTEERHLPVQIRLKTSFPVGTVTLQLQKEERT